MNSNAKHTRGLGAWTCISVVTAALLMASSSFAQFSVSQSGGISVLDNTKATPYPSTVWVTNVLGTLSKATITLYGVSHSYANDLSLLLVGPDGKSVVLMSDAGGGVPLDGATVTFDDDAGALPRYSVIHSGSYKPADYGKAAFAEPAPAAPYGQRLAAVAGGDPNGTWSLYAMDDLPLNAGTINSWTLNLYTTPIITLVTNKVYVDQNSTVSLNLTVQDSSTPAGDIVVSAVSSDQTIITNTGLTVTGNNQGRTVNVTPNVNKYGTVTVTVKANDGVGESQKTFEVVIKHVNQPPTVTLTNEIVATVAGVMTSNLFAKIDDIDHAAGDLKMYASSSNPDVVAPSGVFFSGSGIWRTFTILPSGAATGLATVTVLVSDGALTNSSKIDVVVAPAPQPVFGNPAGLTLSSSGTVSSSISVSSLQSFRVGKVTVSLAGLDDVVASQMSVTLETPENVLVKLFNQSGPSAPVNYAQVTFDDAATAALLPPTDSINNTIIHPTEHLAKLVGVKPNGTWTLYVTNGATGSGSAFLGGWVLNVYAAPFVSSIPDQRMSEGGTKAVNYTVFDLNGKVTNVTATIPDNPGLAKLETTLTGTNVNTAITGNFNQSGTNLVQVVAQDDNGFRGTNTFTLAVEAVNNPPILSFIEKQITRAGEPTAPIPFTVADVDNPLTAVTVTATSDNGQVLPNQNILLQGTGESRTITLFPVGVQSGTAVVTITADDGKAKSTSSFLLYVQEAGNPLFAAKGLITINANAKATPYPSTNLVSGLVGTVAEVEVTLNNMTHFSPGDVSILLVSPDGKKVVLMGKVGKANAMANATLVFSDSAAGSLPDNQSAVSGIYKPTQVATPVFPDGPAGPYSTVLSTFAGSNPNGAWSLWVYDDKAGKEGSIAGGWLLSIRTTPKIAEIATQKTERNVPKRVTVVVGDSQPGVNFNVTATPENPDLVQPIQVSGSGGTRTLLISPVLYKWGETTIRVRATDGQYASETSFLFKVEYVDLPPVISAIPNQSTPKAALVGPISFTVWDPQDNDPNGFTVSASCSDSGLVPSENIKVSWKKMDGSGTNTWSLFMLPAGVRTGSGTVSVTVVDKVGQKATTSFGLTVFDAPVFANETRIDIPEGLPLEGTASPYPSVISVARQGGLVSNIRVALVGLTHPYPADVNVLVVSPDNSKAVMLMAHAGGWYPADDLRIMFNDSASEMLPENAALTEGAFQPSYYGDKKVTLPAPAPAGPYADKLSAFYGLSPNGDWKLYVLDDTFPDDGLIASGWILYLETGPAIAPIAAQTTLENQALEIPIILSSVSANLSNIIVTAKSSGNSPEDLVVPSGLVVSGYGGTRTLKITPTLNLPSSLWLTNAAGTNLITVTAADPNLKVTNSISFALRVEYVNQAPVITSATNSIWMDENASITIPFQLGDVDSSLWATNLVVTSSVADLLPNNYEKNIKFKAVDLKPGTTGTMNVELTPLANKYGTTVVKVATTDGNTSVSYNLTLNVRHIYQRPTISSIVNQSVPAGSWTTNIQFTVDSVEVDPKLLTVTATSSRQDLVPDRLIVLGGSGKNRTIQLTSLGTAVGSSLITVKVSDAATNNATSFWLNLEPPQPGMFANSQPLTISGEAIGTPYPSFITVNGMQGDVFKVTVLVDGLTHTAPANCDLLLVSPDGKAVMLLSGAGGTAAVSGVRLIFDDAAEGLVPADQLASGTYRPTSNTKVGLPPPAPTNGYLATLSGFAGVSPNGQWKLYFNNRGAGDSGRILGGWSLKIQTAPTIVLNTTSPSPMFIDENQKGIVYFTIGDMVTATKDLVVMASSDNPLLLPARAVAISRQSEGNMVATLTPEPYQSGTNNLTLTVYRSDGARDSIWIPMFVNAQNAPPTFSRLDGRATPENTPMDVEFLVQDPDTPLANLILTVESDNQRVVGNTNLLFYGKTNYWAGLEEGSIPQSSLVSLTLRPNADVSGEANIKITAIDQMAPVTNRVATQFKLTVQKVYYPPVIVQLGEQRVPAGGTTMPIGFQVYTRNTPAPTLTVSAVSSNEKFVKKAKIVIIPASAVNVTNRTVTITAEDSGITEPTPVSITLTASDDGGRKGSMTFDLVVLPRPERYYSNTTPLVIADNAAGIPYPSTVSVSELVGRISKINVMLNGFTHTFPSDVGVLLVGPGGQKSVLMNRAGDGGGGQSASNLTLKFDQGAANPIPTGPLSSDSYRPADYKQGLYNFLNPAPAGPYTASLTNFTGSPNGTWSLYVLDDTPGDSGMISNGWTLAVTTEPNIVGLVAMQLMENQTGRQSFTIADDAPAPEPFSLSARSSNTGVLPDKNITFTGSGRNWTVTVAPAQNKFATNIQVTIYASNSYGQTAASSFQVDVQPQMSPPVINQVADQQIAAGTVDVVGLVYSDAHTAHDQLVVDLESSNLVLVPQSGLKLAGDKLRIEPFGDLWGKSQITVSVRNGYGLITKMSFLVTVTPNPMLFANTNAIVISDNSRATPYPSTIAVSGVSGDIVAVTLNLTGFEHTFPSDVSLLLVGPQGEKVVVLSRVGGGVPVTNVRLTLDDVAEDVLPQYGVIVDGTYRPTDYKTSDSFFSPAPPGIYSKTLSAFAGTNPNGTWSLYVQDDASPDGGKIAGGWSLAFATRAPNISWIAPQTVSENSTITVPFVVSSPVSSADRLIASASSSGENPAGLILAGNLIVSGTGSSRVLTITPAANMPSMVSSSDGTATITIAVTDGSYTNTSSFPLTVKYVNQAPAIAGLADKTTPANVPLVVNFTISDVDTPITNLVTTATNSPADLGTVVLSGAGANRTLTFTPKGTVGQAVINVVVSDGNSSTVGTFTVGITSGIVAEVTSIGDREIPENGTLTVEFNIGNADPALVRVTAKTDNPSLVEEVVVQGTGVSRTAMVKLVPYANSETVGPATITITAVDGKIGTGSGSFVLTVTPVDFPPVMEIVPNQAMLPNAQLRVPISVSDPDTALEALIFKAASSNEELVSDIKFETIGANVVAVFTPAKDAQGTAVVTVSAEDSATTRSVRFNLSVTPNAGPRLALAREGQQWMLRISGAPSASYTVQSTGDLKTWSNAGTVTTDENGAAEFRLSAPQTSNSQFYRALVR